MFDTFEDKDDILLCRNILPLKPLLTNITLEEKSIYKKVFKQHSKKSEDSEESEDTGKEIKKLNYNFSKSFILFSKNQVYRTLSIYGLITQFNKNTKYRAIDLAILLNIWYNENAEIKKSDLLKDDVLIIHGKGSPLASVNKAEALVEILSTRKTLNKVTWIYIEESSLDEFDTKYPGVLTEVKSIYNSNL